MARGGSVSPCVTSLGVRGENPKMSPVLMRYWQRRFGFRGEIEIVAGIQRYACLHLSLLNDLVRLRQSLATIAAIIATISKQGLLMAGNEHPRSGAGSFFLVLVKTRWVVAQEHVQPASAPFLAKSCAVPLRQ
jgi:hypothetical protein